MTIGVEIPSSVPPNRKINTTAPLTGGGELSAELTLKLNAASAATANYVIQRDADGRAKVAAPEAADDIARKQEVDEAATKAAWANVTGKPSTYAPSAHNHSATEITSGTLAVARGGTGQTTVQELRNSMGLGNTTGVLPVANGGTGLTTLQATRNAMGLGDTTSYLPVANGGTGSNTAANARNALGVPYSHSIENAGWYKLPGGLIIQWGKSIASATWTFPIAFPTGILCANVCDLSSTSSANFKGVRDQSTTSITVFHMNGSDAWSGIVIGY